MLFLLKNFEQMVNILGENWEAGKEINKFNLDIKNIEENFKSGWFLDNKDNLTKFIEEINDNEDTEIEKLFIDRLVKLWSSDKSANSEATRLAEKINIWQWWEELTLYSFLSNISNKLHDNKLITDLWELTDKKKLILESYLSVSGISWKPYFSSAVPENVAYFASFLPWYRKLIKPLVEKEKDKIMKNKLEWKKWMKRWTYSYNKNEIKKLQLWWALFDNKFDNNVPVDVNSVLSWVRETEITVNWKKYITKFPTWEWETNAYIHIVELEALMWNRKVMDLLRNLSPDDRLHAMEEFYWQFADKWFFYSLIKGASFTLKQKDGFKKLFLLIIDKHKNSNSWNLKEIEKDIDRQKKYLKNKTTEDLDVSHRERWIRYISWISDGLWENNLDKINKIIDWIKNNPKEIWIKKLLYTSINENFSSYDIIKESFPEDYSEILYYKKDKKINNKHENLWTYAIETIEWTNIELPKVNSLNELKKWAGSTYQAEYFKTYLDLRDRYHTGSEDIADEKINMWLYNFAIIKYQEKYDQVNETIKRNIFKNSDWVFSKEEFSEAGYQYKKYLEIIEKYTNDNPDAKLKLEEYNRYNKKVLWCYLANNFTDKDGNIDEAEVSDAKTAYLNFTKESDQIKSNPDYVGIEDKMLKYLWNKNDVEWWTEIKSFYDVLMFANTWSRYSSYVKEIDNLSSKYRNNWDWEKIMDLNYLKKSISNIKTKYSVEEMSNAKKKFDENVDSNFTDENFVRVNNYQKYISNMSDIWMYRHNKNIRKFFRDANDVSWKNSTWNRLYPNLVKQNKTDLTYQEKVNDKYAARENKSSFAFATWNFLMWAYNSLVEWTVGIVGSGVILSLWKIMNLNENELLSKIDRKNDIIEWYKFATSKKTNEAFYSNWEFNINVANVSWQIGTQLMTMLLLLSWWEEIALAYKWLWMWAKLWSRAWLFTSSMLMSFGWHYEKALQLGEKEWDAFYYALTQSIITSWLELISPNDIVTKGFGKWAMEMMKWKTSTWFVASIIKWYAKEMWQEVTQEISQTIAEKLINLHSNSVTWSNFDANISRDELVNIAILTSMTTWLISSKWIITQSIAKNTIQIDALVNKIGYENVSKQIILMKQMWYAGVETLQNYISELSIKSFGSYFSESIDAEMNNWIENQTNIGDLDGRFRKYEMNLIWSSLIEVDADKKPVLDENGNFILTEKAKKTKIIFNWDIICDRWADWEKILDSIAMLEEQMEWWSITILMGNHEAMFLELFCEPFVLNDVFLEWTEILDPSISKFFENSKELQRQYIELSGIKETIITIENKKIDWNLDTESKKELNNLNKRKEELEQKIKETLNNQLEKQINNPAERKRLEIISNMKLFNITEPSGSKKGIISLHTAPTRSVYELLYKWETTKSIERYDWSTTSVTIKVIGNNVSERAKYMNDIVAKWLKFYLLWEGTQLTEDENILFKDLINTVVHPNNMSMNTADIVDIKNSWFVVVNGHIKVNTAEETDTETSIDSSTSDTKINSGDNVVSVDGDIVVYDIDSKKWLSFISHELIDDAVNSIDDVSLRDKFSSIANSIVAEINNIKVGFKEGSIKVIEAGVSNFHLLLEKLNTIGIDFSQIWILRFYQRVKRIYDLFKNRLDFTKKLDNDPSLSLYKSSIVNIGKQFKWTHWALVGESAVFVSNKNAKFSGNIQIAVANNDFDKIKKDFMSKQSNFEETEDGCKFQYEEWWKTVTVFVYSEWVNAGFISLMSDSNNNNNNINRDVSTDKLELDRYSVTDNSWESADINVLPSNEVINSYLVNFINESTVDKLWNNNSWTSSATRLNNLLWNLSDVPSFEWNYVSIVDIDSLIVRLEQAWLSYNKNSKLPYVKQMNKNAGNAILFLNKVQENYNKSNVKENEIINDAEFTWIFNSLVISMQNLKNSINLSSKGVPTSVKLAQFEIALNNIVAQIPWGDLKYNFPLFYETEIIRSQYIEWYRNEIIKYENSKLLDGVKDETGKFDLESPVFSKVEWLIQKNTWKILKLTRNQKMAILKAHFSTTDIAKKSEILIWNKGKWKNSERLFDKDVVRFLLESNICGVYNYAFEDKIWIWLDRDMASPIDKDILEEEITDIEALH